MKRFTVSLAIAVILLVALSLFVAACQTAPVAQVSGYGDILMNGKLVTSTSAVTLTAGQLIQPTKSTYILSSTGNVSMTLDACGPTTGQFIILYGDDANTITVNDTNIYTTDGNAVTLGQYDVVGWACAGTKWSLAWKSANQ